MQAHVVSKPNNALHATISLTLSSNPLPPSSINGKPQLASLTSNNLSYACGGWALHWWDTYPVPADSPAPYNDQSAWGIVPAWGYSTVLESTTPIQLNTQIWGFWPTANAPVDLRLTRVSWRATEWRTARIDKP